MSTLKVLVVGPSISRSKGGIATVINDQLNNNSYDCNVEFEHIVSHVEGSIIEKIAVLLKSFAAILNHAGFDILHIHVASDISIFRKSFYVYLGLLLNKTVVMHVHGGDFDLYYHKSSALVKYFIRKTFSKCHKTLVLSDYWKTFFVKHITKDRVEVLHNGVHTDKFFASANMPLTFTNFLFLGRLTRLKGIYDLLKAIDILVNQRQHKHLKFFLAGNGDVAQVESIIEQKGLTDNVQLLGWLNDNEKVKWLQQVDTVILPSYIEGLPMSLIEAMAAGKVIISSKIGGIPDLVKEENGFLTEPGDVEALYKHILFTYTHPDMMMKMGSNNTVKVAENYNLVKINKRLLDIYFEVTGTQRNNRKVGLKDYALDTSS